MVRVTRAIIVACLVAHGLLSVAGPMAAHRVVMEAGLIPARVTGLIDFPGAVVPALLTPLSSLFLHADWLHLGLNLIFLAWVGRYAEWVLGPWRFLLLYGLGGFGGGMLQVIVAPDSTIPVVGASGAIAAAFGFYAMMFARRRATARRVLGRQLSSELMTALWFAGVWVGLQLMIGLVFNSGGGGVAIWSHIGGFIVGLLFAQPYIRGRHSLAG